MDEEVMVHIDALREKLIGKRVIDANGDVARVNGVILHRDAGDLHAELEYPDGSIIYRSIQSLTRMV